MSKEIEFRGMNKCTKDWAYGYYVSSLGETKSYIVNDLIGDISICSDCGMPDARYIEVISETVGRYMGMNDKNGKRIYEGDAFVHCFNDKVFGVVKYGEYKNICDDSHGGHVGFYVEWKDEQNKGITRVDLAYWIKVSEVVGNIWENPELLKG